MIQLYEDPNINTVARIEAVNIWAQIEARMSKKVFPFHHAREVALAENIPRIMKAYGKEVARRTEAAIMSRKPSTLSKECSSPVDALLMDGARKRHGRVRKRDRLSMWLFGMPWS